MRLIPGVLATLCAAGIAHTAQYCNLSFQACPERFPGVVNVPREAIWLDPKVPVCNEVIQVAKQTSPPPSIMFIIDNSGSMNSKDPQEQRFRVTAEMLDTLFARAPHTEVGLSIFTRRLSFDHRENPLFKPAFPNDTSQHDSYVPLIPLDTVFPNNVRGIDTLKALLRYTGSGNLVHVTRLPASRANSSPEINGPMDVRNGTDITLGFDGAKEGMKAARNQPDNRFFVFLSDGEPIAVDDSRTAMINDFAAGANVPTTFTVYFTSDNQPPAIIQQMTTNIQNNAYSANNPKSAAYSVNLASGGQLAPLLLDQVLSTILLPPYPTTATSAVLTRNGLPPVTSVSVDGKNFTFPGRIPLDSNTTTIQLTYTYSYTDSQGVRRDTTFNHTLTIRRTNTASYPDSTLKASCYEQPNIAVYTTDGNPLPIITADHDSVAVRVTLPAGQSCNNCPAVATPSRSSDQETIILKPGSGYVTAVLHRATSNAPVPGNGKLEHLPTDSIVIIYTNPDNPLEVTRKAFPYNDVRSTLATGPINPWLNKNPPAQPTTTFNETAKWVLVINNNVKVEGPAPGTVETLSPSHPDARIDSIPILPFLGIKIEASRAFEAEVFVFTNHGEFVDKIKIRVDQSEFSKLPPGTKQNTRLFRAYWKGIAGPDNRKAGTGAYVVKYNVALARLAGIAVDRKVSSDVKVMGLVRPRK